jgi:hypothetical protein
MLEGKLLLVDFSKKIPQKAFTPSANSLQPSGGVGGDFVGISLSACG